MLSTTKFCLSSVLIMGFLWSNTGCARSQTALNPAPAPFLPAFPGAEGAGAKTSRVVAADGPGDFQTVQEAIDAATPRRGFSD